MKPVFKFHGSHCEPDSRSSPYLTTAPRPQGQETWTKTKSLFKAFRTVSAPWERKHLIKELEQKSSWTGREKGSFSSSWFPRKVTLTFAVPSICRITL